MGARSRTESGVTGGWTGSRQRRFDQSLQRNTACSMLASEATGRLAHVPGYGPSTRFTQNGGRRMAGLIPEAYAPFAQSVFAALTQPGAVTNESRRGRGSMARGGALARPPPSLVSAGRAADLRTVQLAHFAL